MKWVNKGIEERELAIVCTLEYWQAVDPLLDHRRYQALLRKMSLEDSAIPGHPHRVVMAVAE